MRLMPLGSLSSPKSRSSPACPAHHEARISRVLRSSLLLKNRRTRPQRTSRRRCIRRRNSGRGINSSPFPLSRRVATHLLRRFRPTPLRDGATRACRTTLPSLHDPADLRPISTRGTRPLHRRVCLSVPRSHCSSSRRPAKRDRKTTASTTKRMALPCPLPIVACHLTVRTSDTRLSLAMASTDASSEETPRRCPTSTSTNKDHGARWAIA